MPERDVTLSIVGHGRNALVNQLLGDVQRVCADHAASMLRFLLRQHRPGRSPRARDLKR